MSTVTCIEQPGLTLRKKETNVTLCWHCVPVMSTRAVCLHQANHMFNVGSVAVDFPVENPHSFSASDVAASKVLRRTVARRGYRFAYSLSVRIRHASGNGNWPWIPISGR